ncbi:MAG: DNA internalization-related competence protein ComEC/Rec2 [Polaromonas sp.]
MPNRLARLLTGLLLGFVLGVAVQHQQSSLFELRFYLVLTLVALSGIGLVLRFGRRVLFSLGMVAVLSGALGFGVTGLRATTFAATALNPVLEGQDIEVTGQITAMPQFGEDGVRFRFAVASANLKGEPVALPPLIYLGWYSGFGLRPTKAVVADGDPESPEFSLELQRQPQPLRAGEHWQMTVRLKAPHGNSNPHGFDYELWLWEQGIQATGYVRTSKSDAPPKRLADTWAKPIERARQAVREAIFQRIDNRQLAGVLAALVVGDQNAIERADWDVFRATGVAHLMSISGLHITMFAWAASLLIGWAWRRSARLSPAFCHALPASSAGAWGGLLLAVLYALFSGWGVPAQRTIWMLATVVLLRQSGRQWPWPVVWLLAMVVVVALDSWALMQAGFWLSFVAVGVLFASGAPESEYKSDDKNAINSGAACARIHWATGQNDHENRPKTGFFSFFTSSLGINLMKTLREQWVITLALTPLSLLLFNQVSVIGLLANAAAIPWVTLVVTPLAMLGAFWSPVWDVAALAVNVLTLLLNGLASWSWASISVAAAPLWCAVAGVLGGALLVMRLPLHVKLLGVPLLLPVLLWQPLRPALGQFEVLGADIGQGNALIVRTAKHSLLYDTGPKYARESDAGNRVLVPLLRAMGEKIDLLMLSHRDSDHIGGAPAVLAMQPQARLSSSIEDSHELQVVRRSERCIAGQSWAWDGVDFEVLHPQVTDYDGTAKSNAMSCVLRISNGQKTALLVGDLEAAQELRLVANPGLSPKLKADFLLMPHHGSKTSSTGAFLDAVQPQFALAQSGYRNRFNHPVASVLQRYADRQIRVVNSPVCGAATWRSVQADQVLCQRQQAMRYWHHQPQPHDQLAR